MKKSLGTLIPWVASLAGILFLAYVVVRFVSRKPEVRPVSVSPQTQKATETKQQPSVFDTDGDGLSDWEEKLWGTDPRNPDTDKDGTLDGAEVAAHRNPKKAGPNDSLETPLGVSPLEKGVPESAPPAPEGRAGRAGVVNTPPADLPAEAASAQAGDGSAPLVRGDATTPQIPSLETEGRGTAQPENPLRVFGNALGTVIQNAAVDSASELTFWNSVVGYKKVTEVSRQGFERLAKKYDQLATDIVAVVPPPKAEGVHSALVRAYQNYAKAIHTIAETKVGEYLSGPTLTAYGENTIALGRAVVAVSDLFYSEGVGFLPTEPGSVFAFPR